MKNCKGGVLLLSFLKLTKDFSFLTSSFSSSLSISFTYEPIPLIKLSYVELISNKTFSSTFSKVSRALDGLFCWLRWVRNSFGTFLAPSFVNISDCGSTRFSISSSEKRRSGVFEGSLFLICGTLLSFIILAPLSLNFLGAFLTPKALCASGVFWITTVWVIWLSLCLITLAIPLFLFLPLFSMAFSICIRFFTNSYWQIGFAQI